MSTENRLTNLDVDVVDYLADCDCSHVEFVDEVLPRGMSLEEVLTLEKQLRYRTDKPQAINTLSRIAIARVEIDDMITAGSVVRALGDCWSIRAAYEIRRINRGMTATVRQFQH